MPSSCHNDSDFLFLPLLCRQVIPLVSLSHLPLPGSPFSSSVCCRKPSNEIHTKQDGRVDAFLYTFLSSLIFSLSLLFFSFNFCLASFSSLCPFHLSFTLFPCLCPLFSIGLLVFHFSLLISTVVIVCVYLPFLFPQSSIAATFFFCSIFFSCFHSCILHMVAFLFRQKYVCVCAHLEDKSLHWFY